MTIPATSLPADWPAPDADALAVSVTLVDALQAEMLQQPVSFARYMERCLYEPGLGYYSAGARKFGAAGDFVTAPEITPIYSRALAHSCATILQHTDGVMLELGAGSGVMAADILQTLQAMDQLPEQYLILERSAELKLRQQQNLALQVPELLSRVSWLEGLPDQPINGVVIANEVLDALPVERFHLTNAGLEQAFVGHSGTAFVTHWQPATANLQRYFEQRLDALNLPLDYQSECCPLLDDWIAALSDVLSRGAMLFVDYGYARAEYYHPSRAQGTLMCHYRHRAHPDAYLLPGLQDITAYVDFTTVAEAAVAAGMNVSGFTTQAHYLLDVGLDALLADVQADGSADYFRTVQAVKQLMLPGEMGERFKAILLTKNMNTPVPGFGGQDFRSRL